MTTLIQANLFDYEALDTEARIVVQQRTSEIKGLMRKAAQDIIDIGQKLIEVKARLNHGQFGPWLEAEFAWSQETAGNFMRVARTFAKEVDYSRFAPSALYLLAAPSTPERARAEALARTEAGETITRKEARHIVTAHKQAALTLDTSLVDVPDVAFRAYEPPIRTASDEAALVRALATHLTEQGERVTLQVGCAIGIADLVTDRAVYEIKYWLTRTHFVTALGQVLLYREAINPALRAVIVGFSVVNVPLGDLVEYAQQLGVEVLVCNS